jgi:xanthine dehydrogenase iron-sulfur cluster and FAD-binding subunit A
MNPLEQKVQELERRLTAIERVENVAFIQTLERRLDRGIKLNDLIDVAAPSPSVGQVLKWNGTTWAPATDNT